jgi:two-component system, LytTR family, sensor histidine kinase AlgZ
LATDANNNDSQAYLPDFCAATTVLVIILVAELVAIVLTLASHNLPGTFLTELAKMSMFIQWLTLLSAALLCRLRPWLESFGGTRTFIVAFLLLELLCLLMAEVTWRATSKDGLSVVIDDDHLGFVMRTFAVSSIVVALTMRYLYVASEWRRSIVLEAQARVSALQALIRPHFLFNSMNTIASLTRTDPQRAEEAVEDLADLFRANLGGPKNRTTLKQEFEVAAIYQRIEKLRLGDRLSVRWDINDLPMRALIPSLTIQPLLENAIYHGIELLPDGGEVVVSGKRDGANLCIRISNPVVAGKQSNKDGNNMAMSNIRQRFELAYAGRASIVVEDGRDEFRVVLTFPNEETDP